MIAKMIDIKQHNNPELKQIRELEKKLEMKFSLTPHKHQEFGKYQYSRLQSSENICITTMVTHKKPTQDYIEISFLISTKDEQTTGFIEKYIKKKFPKR
jgi:hypothetical protein